MLDRTLTRTYGTVSAEQRKTMSGLAYVQRLADGTLPLNTIAETLGYDVTSAASGRVTVAMEPNGKPWCAKTVIRARGRLAS